MDIFKEINKAKYLDENIKREVFLALTEEKITTVIFNFILENIKEIKSRNPRLYHKLVKELKRRIIEIKEIHGPIYKEKDINYLRKKIRSFFDNPFFSNSFPISEKIKFYLFGSLVNGFCNNPRSKNYKKPSDKGRLSDVDILVVISRRFFDQLFGSNLENTLKVNNVIRTLPIGFTNPLKPVISGPFEYLFEELSNITFAGAKNRPITFVFVEDYFLKKIDINKEPHIHILDIEIK